MESCAIVKSSDVWPHRSYVCKSEHTTLCQIYLNKLWIPDVLIDIIKDFLYIGAEEILRRFYKNSINSSILQLSYDSFHYVDNFGRRRLTTWTIGYVYCPNPEVQLQQTLCTTCGEKCEFHPNLNGCCELEWDDEDGTLELEVETDHVAIHVENEVDIDEEDIDEDDLYDSWHPWGSTYKQDDDEDDNELEMYDPYYRNDAYSRNNEDSEKRNVYRISK